MTDTRKILDEREKTHGKYEEHARVTQDVLTVWMREIGWLALTPSMREALHMVAHKCGRIVCGDPAHQDHWQDICGYAQLVVDQLNSKKGLSAIEESTADEYIKNFLPSTDHVSPKDLYCSWISGQQPRDGRPTSDTLPIWPHIVVFNEYLLVDRSKIHPDDVERLPRIPLTVNTTEWSELPPYYQPLYVVDEDTGGVLIGQYRELWGK